MADRFTGVEVVEWDGQTPFPPVAPAGKARVVYETVTNCLAVSINGGAYQCLLFGNQVGGGGVVAAGVDDLPTVGGTYRLAPWNEAITAGAAVFEWSAPADGTLRNFFVRHNVAGVGGDITYEWYLNGAATGLLVTLSAAGIVGSDLVNSVNVLQGDRLELRATHAGITTSPQRIMATAVFGVGAFGQDYLRVDSPALFSTGAGVPSPQAFVTKPGAVLVTPVLTGTYQVRWHLLMSAESSNIVSAGRLFNVTDGVIVGTTPQRFQPPSGSDEVEDMNGAENIAFAGVSKTFEIQVRKFDGPNPGSISCQEGWIEILRVGP